MSSKKDIEIFQKSKKKILLKHFKNTLFALLGTLKTGFETFWAIIEDFKNFDFRNFSKSFQNSDLR